MRSRLLGLVLTAGVLLGSSVFGSSIVGCGGDEAGLILVYPNDSTAQRTSTLSVYVFRTVATDLCAQPVSYTHLTLPTIYSV